MGPSSSDKKGLHYSDYLGLQSVLSAQHPVSQTSGKVAHDELLFIIIHQTYELWFKQMLFEVDSVIDLFKKPPVPEKQMAAVVQRLNRCVEIFKVLIHQVDVLETMTPLDFLEFRDLLYPASGFQSAQFRLLENKLGLRKEKRETYGGCPYSEQLRGQEKATVIASESTLSLFEVFEKWLERTPFLQSETFNFWDTYKKAVSDGFATERAQLEKMNVSSDQKEALIAALKNQESGFLKLFDEADYQAEKDNGNWRLSYKAVHGALFIQLYRDEPQLQMPFRFLTLLLDLDLVMTQWRYRHALMAQKMLGRKMGTGGSSGADYLRKSATTHSVFQDLIQLTTFLLPRSKLPELPKSVLQFLTT